MLFSLLLRLQFFSHSNSKRDSSLWASLVFNLLCFIGSKWKISSIISLFERWRWKLHRPCVITLKVTTQFVMTQGVAMTPNPSHRLFRDWLLLILRQPVPFLVPVFSQKYLFRNTDLSTESTLSRPLKVTYVIHNHLKDERK